MARGSLKPMCDSIGSKSAFLRKTKQVECGFVELVIAPTVGSAGDQGEFGLDSPKQVAIVGCSSGPVPRCARQFGLRQRVENVDQPIRRGLGREAPWLAVCSPSIVIAARVQRRRQDAKTARASGVELRAEPPGAVADLAAIRPGKNGLPAAP